MTKTLQKAFSSLIILALALALMPVQPTSAVDIFTEPFDDSSQFTLSAPFFSDGGGDYFGLTDGTTGDFGIGAMPSALRPYSGFDGYFMAGMDLDAEGAELPIIVDWTGIDITGQTDLAFSGDFAETFELPGDIDAADYIRVQYQIDGGGYQELLWFSGADFSSTSGPYNGIFREDTDFDGVGDGTALGDAAQTFEKPIAGSGTTLDLRLMVLVEAGDEDFGVDNFTIYTAEPAVPDVLINEVDSDTPSYDVLEFIELYDGGTGNTALDGLVVVLFNGSDDLSYTPAFDLDGYTTNADGYFVIGSVPGADLYVDPGSQGWLQNGTDAVALYLGDEVDFPNDSAISTENLLDAIVYDTNDSDDAALLALLNAGQPQVNEDGSGDKDNHSNQRCPNGEGGARNTDTYTQFTPTPGAANCEEPPPPPEACGDPFTPIYAVQGNGAASPLVGTEVAIEGVLVGDFQNNGNPDNGDLNGFYVQDPTGDSDASTSDGVFVYAPSGMDVSVGDAVRVRGNVSEYNGVTQVGASQIWQCSTGNSVTPTLMSMPMTSMDGFEAYEGMLVTIFDPISEELTASQNYFQGRYGQVTMSSGGRLYNPTNLYRPLTDEAVNLAVENLARMIVLDDGTTSQNPNPIPYIGMDNTLRAGDTVDDLTGVMDYGPINSTYPYIYHYRLQPTELVEFTRENERTATPEDVGGVIKIASFNVLNYFNGDGMGGGFPTSRGADTLDEFVRQRDKIISAISAMDADVIGLMEIENDGYDEYSAIADLVNGLNDAAGAGTYAFIDPGVGPVGTDEIAVGLIYKTSTVTPVGDSAIIDSAVDPYFNSDYNRPAIAQTFERITGGGRFTAVVNHLKSKGSCPEPGDEYYGTLNDDQGDGQGCWNLMRSDAATALVNWLATDPTGSEDPDFFIIGDLNSYAKEDPIIAIEDAGYTNLVEAFEGAEAYSYIFDGQAGYLDHALATAQTVPYVMGTTIWHINADEPSVIDYNTEYKPQDLYTPTPYRSSDHDPVVVGFCDAVAPIIDSISVSPDTLWPANHKYVDVTATVVASDNIDLNPTITLVSVTSNEPDNGDDDGDTINDIVIVDDFNFQLRAERSGIGTGRIYTITYQVTDVCGNSTTQSVTVTVPLSQGN